MHIISFNEVVHRKETQTSASGTISGVNFYSPICTYDDKYTSICNSYSFYILIKKALY